MTDKEIIIDGVDVSKCGYFQSSCIPDYSGGYLYKNVCRNHGFYDCDKKPCAFKCIEYQKQLKHKEQELQAQRNFTAQEQRKIYCAAYDKTCETGNECKQKKCTFKDRLKYKQALDEIRQYRVCEINDVDGEEDDVILGIIDEVMEP